MLPDSSSNARSLQCSGKQGCSQPPPPVLVILYKRLQAKAFKAVPEHVVHVKVAGPKRVQALLGHNCQRFSHAVEGADGPGVMVAALSKPTPVVP